MFNPDPFDKLQAAAVLSDTVRPRGSRMGEGAIA